MGERFYPGRNKGEKNLRTRAEERGEQGRSFVARLLRMTILVG